MDELVSQETHAILNELPILIAAAASIADLATDSGTTRELMTALSTLLAGVQLLRHNALVQSVFDDYKRDGQGEARILSLSQDPPDDLIPRSLAQSRAAAAALAPYPDQDAVIEFKLWLRGLAADIVASSHTGGFLGFGGTAVTQEEDAYVDRLTVALELDIPRG